jgi:hypothetical protein
MKPPQPHIVFLNLKAFGLRSEKPFELVLVFKDARYTCVVSDERHEAEKIPCESTGSDGFTVFQTPETLRSIRTEVADESGGLLPHTRTCPFPA